MPGGMNDLERQFAELGMERDREQYGASERERKVSGLGRPRAYSTSDPDRARKISSNFGDRPNIYNGAAAGPYSRPSGYPQPGNVSPYGPPNPYPNQAYPSSRPASPFAPGGPGAGPQVYPRGHIMEGQPIRPRSRATTPLPGGGPGVPFPQSNSFPQPSGLGQDGSYPGEQQLSSPPCFSRPVNAAQPYTPFETMKIQDMDDFAGQVPRMPAVLQPHDVYHEDWIRIMQVCISCNTS